MRYECLITFKLRFQFNLPSPSKSLYFSFCIFFEKKNNLERHLMFAHQRIFAFSVSQIANNLDLVRKSLQEIGINWFKLSRDSKFMRMNDGTVLQCSIQVCGNFRFSSTEIAWLNTNTKHTKRLEINKIEMFAQVRSAWANLFALIIYSKMFDSEYSIRICILFIHADVYVRCRRHLRGQAEG